ncbi:hypothetical protein R7X80_00445 [Mesomycoplasma ovipneumoniae]|uniref:hypothetical protein n=1 Tax=Mesomycoplasma ovipneumoniae TaxID=29562 RepID=UPI002965714C|nr:hypothetical protein [Mesomycoplasma ovipneumoniae]MDW2930312.1 hypothetical protein [Mesomycoplasma ovipneumoniae]
MNIDGQNFENATIAYQQISWFIDWYNNSKLERNSRQSGGSFVIVLKQRLFLSVNFLLTKSAS